MSSSALLNNNNNRQVISMGFSSSNLTRAKSTLRPVRPHQRLIPDKIANTGQDPKGKFYEFMKNDIIKPLSSKTVLQQQQQRSENKTSLETSNANRWALNTAKICSSPENLPKLQAFKEYNFVKVNPLEAQNYQKNYSKTDHISMKVPPARNTENKAETFWEKKSNFFFSL